MWRRRLAVLLILSAAGAAFGASTARANVLRVGSWNGISGQFKSIQKAVNAAHPGDWILVGPGDYKERGYRGQVEPAGVLITTPNLHHRASQHGFDPPPSVRMNLWMRAYTFYS